MKTIIKISILVSVLGLVAYLITHIQSGLAKKERIEQNRARLPDFVFTDLDGSNFTNEQLDVNQPTVLISFMPTCHFCQYEAKAIQEHSEAFAGTNLLLVTNAPEEEAKVFAAEYGLMDTPNVTVLIDEFHQFNALFGTSVVPTVFIYDQEQQLTKHFTGETKIEAILKYIDMPVDERLGQILNEE